jgi:STE24 endopeptidase
MTYRKVLSRVCLAFALLACASGSRAQQTPGPGAKPATAMPDEIPVPPTAQPSAHFDVEAATEAYLAEIPAGARAKSDAYFEGGYWLILWDFLYGAVMYLLLLHFRWSARLRNFAERITRFKPLQTLIYWTEFLVVTTVLGAPLAIYEGYTRERQYGLATQTFGPWMGEQLEMLVLNIVVGGVAAMVLFGVVRRLPRTWWLWGAVVSMFFCFFW